MKRIALVAAGLALVPLMSACALVDRSSGEAVLADLPGQIEPVHAAVIARDQAVFRVSSNGCTARADIQPVVRRTGDGPTVSLRRIKEDRCRQVQPDGVEMRWSFEELGLAHGSRLSVETPFQLPPG